MIEILYILIGLGPYFLAALVLGFGLGSAAPWMLKHPERWLFFAIFGLSVLAIGGGDMEGSRFKQVSWGGLFLLMTFHATRNEQGRVSFPFSFLPWSLVLLVVYALLSVTWSPALLVSAKRAVELVGIVLMALALARQIKRGVDISELISIPVAVFLVIGLLFAALAPSYAFDHSGALKAISTHKNTWGQFSLIAAITFLAAVSRSNGYRKRIWIGTFLLAAISLAATRSVTSLLPLVVILCVAGLWYLLNRNGNIGVLVFSVLVVLVALIFHIFVVINGELPFDKLASLFYQITGKTPDMTGRSLIWQLMQAEIARHPWLGIGYNGFWTGQEGPANVVISRFEAVQLNQAHSGYIDLINELGYIGGVLFVLVILQHSFNLRLLWLSGKGAVAFFHIAVFVSALIINYSESSIMRSTHLWWILLCFSIVSVQAYLNEHRSGMGQSAETL